MHLGRKAARIDYRAILPGLVFNLRQELFEHLLRVTRDKGRRAALRQELQKIWLLEGGRSGDESPALKSDDAASIPFLAPPVSPPGSQS